MQRGDIEIRIRGKRLPDLDGTALAEIVLAVSKALGARLIEVRPTYLTFRPMTPKPEAPCASNT